MKEVKIQMDKKKDPELRKGKHTSSILTVKAVEDNSDEYVLNFVGSSETPDRHGDIVKSDDWNLSAYEKNPVFLWGHDHSGLPIGRAENVSVNTEEKRLEFKIKFAVEEYPFAKTVYKLYKGGFLNATSVGFIPKDVDYDEDKDAFILSNNELLELSAVTVPANPDALQMGFKKGLLDKEDLNGMRKQGMMEAIEKSMDKQEVEDFEKTVEEEVETTEEKDEVVDTTTGDETEKEETTTEPQETEETSDTEEPPVEETNTEEKEVEGVSKKYIDNLFSNLTKQIKELKDSLMSIDEKLKAAQETVEQEEVIEEDGEETPEKTQTEDPKPEEVEEDVEEEKSEEPQVITFENIGKYLTGRK